MSVQRFSPPGGSRPLAGPPASAAEGRAGSLEESTRVASPPGGGRVRMAGGDGARESGAAASRGGADRPWPPRLTLSASPRRCRLSAPLAVPSLPSQPIQLRPPPSLCPHRLGLARIFPINRNHDGTAVCTERSTRQGCKLILGTTTTKKLVV